MIGFNNWINNYIDVLNNIYADFLIISSNNNINLPNNDDTFNNFCKMIYYSSQNISLKNPSDFDYIN
jgi:hypothetical protein